MPSEDRPKELAGHDEAPLSVTATDIEIDAIVQIGAHFRDLHFERGIRGEPIPEGQSQVSLEVDMEVFVEQATRRSALVRLAITARPDGPALWEASADYVAVYSVGEKPARPLEEFAWSNGLANLVPFIRERIASLTQASNFATYVLPPISIARLRELHERQADRRSDGDAVGVSAPL